MSFIIQQNNVAEAPNISNRVLAHSVRKEEDGDSVSFYEILQGAIGKLSSEYFNELENHDNTEVQNSKVQKNEVGVRKIDNRETNDKRTIDNVKDAKFDDRNDLSINKQGKKKDKQDNVDKDFKKIPETNKKNEGATKKYTEVLSSKSSKSKTFVQKGIGITGNIKTKKTDGFRQIQKEKIELKKVMMMKKRAKEIKIVKNGKYRSKNGKIIPNIKNGTGKGLYLDSLEPAIKEKHGLGSLKNELITQKNIMEKNRGKKSINRRNPGIHKRLYSLSAKNKSATEQLSAEYLRITSKTSQNNTGKGDISIDLADHLKDYISKLKTPNTIRGSQSIFGNTNLQKADEVFREIIQRLNFLVTKGGGEARISLKPDFLGKLFMKVSVNQHRVDAVFMVENEAMRELLFQRMAALEHGLGQQGFSLGSFDVEVGNERSWLNSETQKRSGTSGAISDVNSKEDTDNLAPVLEIDTGSIRSFPWMATRLDLLV